MVFQFCEMSSLLKLAMSNSVMHRVVYDFCGGLPEYFDEFTERCQGEQVKMADGEKLFKYQIDEARLIVFELYVTNIDFTPSGILARQVQLQRDEMLGTLWHVYKRRTTTSVYEIRFSDEGNKVEVTDDAWTTLNFTWERIDENNIAIMDGSTEKWKCSKLDNKWLSLFKIFDDG